MLATQMDRNASGDRARDWQFGKFWGLDLGACISVRIFGGGPAGSVEQLRLVRNGCGQCRIAVYFPRHQVCCEDALGFIARSIGLGDCRRHQPHGRIHSIQRLFSQEHLFNCRRAVRSSCLASVFQRFVEGPGQNVLQKKN